MLKIKQSPDFPKFAHGFISIAYDSMIAIYFKSYTNVTGS